jgi:two-component system chemotaxis response regulator CheY
MIISSQLLHRIADPTIPKDERAQLRCQLAKELEDVGNYEAAREAMGELWPRFGEHPVLNGLDEVTAAEVLLRVGVLTGWIGSVRQIKGAEETARNLISQSLARFEPTGLTQKIAEAQMELGHCYWREGYYNEARVWLREASSRLPDSAGDLKAITLLRLATVESSAQRLSDALRINLEAAPLFDKSKNHTLKGKFHNEFGFVLRNLSTAEHRDDYIDRALIEYTAASFHFEQAGHTRYQGCVENNLGFLFLTIKKFAEAHEHLDRAQALFTGMKDIARTAGVDETRARVLLAEGRTTEAERLVRSAVQVLERGGQQSLLAEALTTHGLVLARIGNYKDSHDTLKRAVDVAENAGDLEAAGLAALIILEELSDHLPAQELSDTYDRAAELLSRSGNHEYKDRLLAASRRVMFLMGALPTPSTWKGFNFYEAVVRFEARIIERALKETGGVVTRAAQLLGIGRESLGAMLRSTGRHTALAHLRAPVEHRARSLMFRSDEDCPETRAVVVLHVEDEATVSEPVSMVLHDEGWSVETCTDGATALEKLESGERFDVLIFDNNLPNINGVELIKRTRALAHRQRTPIIMLSGGEVEVEARRAGANYFLPKPSGIASLAETVAHLLARKKGRES